ncbi:MAG: HAD family hydrolase [Faecousia sp.]
MIRNIVFDMGNVLLYFDRDYFISRLGIEGEDKELLKREVFLSLEWARMDRGSMTDAEAAESVCRRLPEHLHEAARKLVQMWDRPILPIDGMYELIEELKAKGYGIYLLSNASFRQHDYWPRIPASRFFDGTMISADEKVVKPQPEIYRLLLERFHLQAEECFFIDDVPANIEGAFYCGIPGAVFHGDAGLLRRDLRAAGVEVAETTI